MPPARPIELASAGQIGLATRTDAGPDSGLAKASPAAPRPALTPDERAQLRTLFAAAASGSAPGPRVKVAIARAKAQGDAPSGFVATPGAGLALGFSGKPADLPGNRFTGPAVKPLPVLR
jgi:hypothetical protein